MDHHCKAKIIIIIIIPIVAMLFEDCLMRRLVKCGCVCFLFRWST